MGWGSGGGRGRGRVWGGQGGCDRRIEKFLGKFTKKIFQGGGVGLGGGGVRVDVNEELKFLCIFKKKKNVGGGVRGVGLGGGGSGWMRTKNISFCENSKKKFFLGGGRGERSGGWGVGEGSVWGSGWM